MAIVVEPPGTVVARAAAQLVGAKFRLHGRNPQTGLDCVGVAECALAEGGARLKLPMGYRLRNSSIARYIACAQAAGLKQVAPPIEAGDVLLVRTGPAQHHLLIAESASSFIHAHASLGRVVRSTGPPPWPIEIMWRALPKG